MAERRAGASRVGAGLGLAIGAGLGGTTAALLGLSIATVAGFSVGGGLVVGAAVGRLAEANLGRERFGVRVFGGAAVFGVLVGAPVGAVGAWTVDGPLASGLGIGAFVGLVHGSLVAGLLLASIRREGQPGQS